MCVGCLLKLVCLLCFCLSTLSVLKAELHNRFTVLNFAFWLLGLFDPVLELGTMSLCGDELSTNFTWKKLKHSLHRNERMCMINIILSHSCLKSWENCEVQMYSRSWLLCLEMLERKTLAWALLIEDFWQKMLMLYSIQLPHWTLRLPSNQLLLSTFWGQDEWYSCAKTLPIWRLVSVVMFKWSVKSNGKSN